MDTSTDTSTDHQSYTSLEAFRLRLISDYLITYSSAVVVQEKIHGSNFQITGTWIDGKWFFQIGSRKRWVTADEKFNNIHNLFARDRTKIISLFDEIREGTNDITIRLYGEIYGGKYGGEKALNAIATQNEVNYCPDNDIAFFDLVVNDKTMPILRTIDLVEKHGIRMVPLIFKGNLFDFVKDFNVNSFESVVSQKFYGLPFLNTPKATEGVTVRTTNPDAEGDEAIVLKWKQDWAVENRRVNQSNPSPITDDKALERESIAMLNPNRIDSYASKISVDELTNPRFIGKHVKEIIADTMVDILKEFPNAEYPELDRKLINKKLSQIAFPMFKKFLMIQSMTPEMRIKNLSVEGNNLAAEASILSQRLAALHERVAILG